MVDGLPDIDWSGAQAVRERDKRQRRWFVGLMTLILLMAAAVGLEIRTSYQLSKNSAIQRQHLQQAVCQMDRSFRAMARRFGARLHAPRVCLGNDPVFVGTNGNDTIDGTPHQDWINGEKGNDLLRGHGGSDTLIGSRGNDVEAGNSGEDYHYGGAGNDTIYATARDGVIDHLDGGPGKDTCVYRGKVVLVSCERKIKK